MDIIYERNLDKISDELIQVNKTSMTNKVGYVSGARQQQQQQLQPPAPAPPPAPSTSAKSPPPSSSTSPSHEFSFTISINNPSTTTPRTTPQASPFAVDLSPADDIFFHGHLLPLHLLSHLPISPRTSTNSIDSSLTLPINKQNNQNDTINNNNMNTTQYPYQKHDQETKTRTKSKSFSIFGLPKRRKSGETIVKDNQEHDDHQKNDKTTTKLKFDINHVLKRYLRMVRPLLSFGNSSRRENKMQHIQRQAYTFSGNTSFRDYNDDERLIRGKKIQYSAPASMRTSPNNSGPLLMGNGKSNLHSCSSSSDSTMEELQAAIQAAIAHCKNSISMEDKKKVIL